MLIVCLLCASSVLKILLSTEEAHKKHTSSSPIIRFSLPEQNLTLPDDDSALAGRIGPIVIEQWKGKNLPARRSTMKSEEICI